MDSELHLTLGALCERAAQRWPGELAIAFDATGERFTFDRLHQRSNALAQGLLSLGLQPGERVAVMCGNVPAFPITWLAMAKLGAVMVPVNPAYRAADAEHLMRHAEVAMVVTDADRAALAHRLASGMPHVRRVLVSGGQNHEFESLLDTSSCTMPDVAVWPETLLNIQYTSGTTGLPKGCMQSHRYWMQLAELIGREAGGLSPQDVLITAQPFSYLDPQWNLAAALANGAALVVMERFRPAHFWAAVQRWNASFFYCIGAMPAMLLAQPEAPEERAHRLRVVICSGIPADKHHELQRRFGAPWREAYGTTETGADIAVPQALGEALAGSGCIGQALPHREARIMDAQGNNVPRGQMGELLLRGPGMMDGYFRNPQATAEVFANGWYHTGDLATMDALGSVRIVGRTKDMIRRSGENIAAAEVEAAIESHPQVLLAACVAVPDALRGEEVKAYVQLREPDRAQAFDCEGLARHVEQRLARFKVPRYWELSTELPRTPSERVAKHLLPASPGGYDRGACAR